MSATTKRESLQDLLDSLPNLVEHFYNDTLTPHAATRSAMSPVPAEFTNWRDEQHAWRETAVLFDQSHHMPELFLKGPDAFKLLNYVGINSFDKFVPGRAKQYLGCGPDGKVIGERRFIGLYTSTAYLVPTSEIPIVRRKCANIIRRAGFLAKGHLHKSLVTVLEQYPREELFEADEDDLFDIALGVLRLQEHQRTRLFVRRDRFDRFVSCLVFVPRDKFNTDLRKRIAKVLMKAFNGKSIEFTPLLSESPLARIYITVRSDKGAMPEADTRELEQQIVQVARRWQDDLADALIDSFGEEQGNRLVREKLWG